MARYTIHFNDQECIECETLSDAFRQLRKRCPDHLQIAEYWTHSYGAGQRATSQTLEFSSDLRHGIISRNLTRAETQPTVSRHTQMTSENDWRDAAAVDDAI